MLFVLSENEILHPYHVLVTKLLQGLSLYPVQHDTAAPASSSSQSLFLGCRQLQAVLFTLGDVIDRHSMLHSEFADDTQLYDSVCPEHVPSLVSRLQA